MKYKIIICIFLFLLIFGCSELSREEQNLCESMTSKSFDYIPYCSSEDACFSRLNGLISTDFEIPTNNKIYHLKNDFARSWYFYNKAIKSIEEVNDICDSKNISNLPGEINQSRFYLEEAFEETDSGIKKSLEIISQEVNFLEREDIHLIKEEKIYDSYTSFKQIIAEISEESPKSDSYISFYNEKFEKFKNSSSKIPSNLIEKDSIYLSLLNSKHFLPEEIANINIKNKGKIYSLSDSFDNFFDYFKNWFLREESLGELKKLPTKEIMLLYSDISSEKNSVLENFSKQITTYNNNYIIIKNKRNELYEKINSLQDKATKLINENNNEEINFLYNKLFSENISNEINEYELYEENNQKLISFRKNKAMNKFSIGKEINEAKELINNYEYIIKKSKEKSINENQKIKEKCNSISEEILNYENTNFQIKNLFSEMMFYANRTLKNEESKFYFCKKTILLKEYYLTAKKDFELLKAKQIDLTKNCFSYLDKVLLKSNLEELKTLYIELKKEKVTESNLFYFKEACEKLKSQTNKELKNSNYFEEILIDFKQLKSIKADFELLVDFFDSKQKTNLGELNKKIESYEDFIKNDELILENFAGKEKEISIQLNSDIDRFSEILKEEKIDEITKNVAISNNSGVAYLNKEFKSELIVKIDNPFEEIKEEVLITIPLEVDFNNNELIIDYFKGREKTLVKLNKIPNGITNLVGSYKSNINYEIDKKVIFANNKNSVIEYELNILNKEIFSKVFFEIESFKNNKINVFFNGKETDFLENKGKLSFVLEDISNKSNILIHFYTDSLITLKNKKINVKDLDLHTQIIEYELIAKNNYSEKITADLLIDFFKNTLVEEINLYDSEFVNKRINFIDEYILLKNIEFFSGEEKEFLLILKINNSKEYYSRVLEDLSIKLINIDDKLRNDILNHLTYEFSENWIKKSIDLITRANEKIENNLYLENKNKEIELIRNKLKENLKYLEETNDELTKIGLINSSDNLVGIINKNKQLIDSNNYNDLVLVLKNLNDLNFYLEDSIKDELNIIKEDLDEIDNEELDFEKEELLKNISNLLNLKNYNDLKENYLKIKDDYANLLLKETEIQNENLEESQKVNNLLIESKGLIEIIRRELDFESLELINIRFIPPITKNRLEQLEEKLNEYNEELLENKFEILNINNELKNAYSEIKYQAIKKYNQAIDEGINKSTLKKARELIDNNNYVSSMFTLENNNNTPTFDFIGIIPIALILIISIVIVFIKKQKNQEEDKTKNIVEESWKD
jgi:hypothetical protein